EACGDMQLARAEGPFLAILVVGRIKPDFAQADAGCVPEVRVALYADVRVWPPVIENERPVAHERARARPWAPALLAAPIGVQRRHVDRVERGVRQQH